MDDASERAIEEDMLDQFNYFDDEDEELIDRREPASLDAFDLVGEEPDEDEGESTEPPHGFGGYQVEHLVQFVARDAQGFGLARRFRK